MVKKIAIVVIAHLIGWSLAWLAGFDFNERAPLVACWEAIVLVVGCGVACLEELSI